MHAVYSYVTTCVGSAESDRHTRSVNGVGTCHWTSVRKVHVLRTCPLQGHGFASRHLHNNAHFFLVFVKTAGYKSGLRYQRSYENFKKAHGGADKDQPNVRALLLTTHQVKNSHVSQRERAYVVTPLALPILKSPPSMSERTSRKRKADASCEGSQEDDDDEEEGERQGQLKSVRAC
jgi:hypothetical protein